MEGFRQWAGVACAAALVCTMLRQLFPENGLGRQGRMLLPCVFLCALLAPLPKVIAGVEIPDFTQSGMEQSEALQARTRQQLISQMNTSLLAMANQALAGYGWQAKKVVTDMDIGEDGSIHMGQITLYVDEKTAAHAAAIRQIVEKRLGAPVVLAVWEGTP